MRFALIAYGLVALCLLRPVAGHWAILSLAGYNRRRAAYPYNEPPTFKLSWQDWVLGYLCAWFVAAVWPLCLLTVATSRFAPKIGAERKHDLAARERRLRDAERDLGLEPWETR